MPIFQFFHVFQFLGLGRGDVLPKYGVGRCFPIFGDGVGGSVGPFWGWGGGGGVFGVGGGFPPVGPISPTWLPISPTWLPISPTWAL